MSYIFLGNVQLFSAFTVYFNLNVYDIINNFLFYWDKCILIKYLRILVYLWSSKFSYLYIWNEILKMISI